MSAAATTLSTNLSAAYRQCEGRLRFTRNRRCMNRAREGFHTCGTHKNHEAAVLAGHAAEVTEAEQELVREEHNKMIGQRIIIYNDEPIRRTVSTSTLKERFDIEEVENHYMNDSYHVLYGARYYDSFKKYHVLYLAPSRKEAQAVAQQKEYSTWYADALYPSDEEEKSEA
jgi:hypothetical protein